RIAWQIERHFGRYGEIRDAQEVPGAVEGDRLFETSYSNPRGVLSWVLGLGANATLQGPPELSRELARRLKVLKDRPGRTLPGGEAKATPAKANGAAVSRPRGGSRRAGAEEDEEGPGRPEAAIRPERFARLVTLASMLIQAGRAGERVSIGELRERLQLSEEELQEDVNVLNVVNFGGGSYVLYAEIDEQAGGDEGDPEPLHGNLDRPAPLQPVEAKALVAAIDLIGEHIPEGSLASAREKIVAALGEDPMEQGLQVARAGGDDVELAREISEAIVANRLVELEYYKENE